MRSTQRAPLPRKFHDVVKTHPASCGGKGILRGNLVSRRNGLVEVEMMTQIVCVKHVVTQNAQIRRRMTLKKNGTTRNDKPYRGDKIRIITKAERPWCAPRALRTRRRRLGACRSPRGRLVPSRHPRYSFDAPDAAATIVPSPARPPKARPLRGGERAETAGVLRAVVCPW